jgi:hypothetical protein
MKWNFEGIAGHQLIGNTMTTELQKTITIETSLDTFFAKSGGHIPRSRLHRLDRDKSKAKRKAFALKMVAGFLTGREHEFLTINQDGNDIESPHTMLARFRRDLARAGVKWDGRYTGVNVNNPPFAMQAHVHFVLHNVSEAFRNVLSAFVEEENQGKPRRAHTKPVYDQPGMFRYLWEDNVEDCNGKPFCDDATTRDAGRLAAMTSDEIKRHLAKIFPANCFDILDELLA